MKDRYPSFVTRTTKNEIYLLTCFSNVNLMLGCCVFKNLSASDSQLKRHIIINISSIQNYFTFLKCIQPQLFIITHEKINQDRTKGKTDGKTIYLVVKYTLKNKISNWCCKFKGFLNSAFVMFKSRLCSNNKLTAISIVSLNCILVNNCKRHRKLKTYY